MAQAKTNDRRARLCFWVILLLGAAVRLWAFGRVPGDLNQDEAFAGYEAWALLHGGLDTAGQAWPVYLTAWGSGMNALESYLMLPFLALFKLKVWALRLPQLLLALASLPTLYLMLRRQADQKTALWAMLLLAICPWHVLLSRWGLESNLAPALLLFGTALFLRALDDGRFLPLSALCYGLSLYAYATLWPILPPLLLLQGLYSARHGRLRLDRYLALAVLLLGLMALPLLLFVAVNLGFLEPLRLGPFTVPRLLVLRAGEFSAKNAPQNLARLLRLLWTQSDGLPWNSAGPYGLLYPLTTPFVLLGLGLCAARLWRGRGRFQPEALLLLWLGGGLLLGALIQVNVNRVNLLFLPLILLAALGLRFISGRLRWAGPLLLAGYLIFFGCFARWYFSDYRAQIGYSFSAGLEQAVEAALAEDGEIVVSRDILYPKLLFYSAEDPAAFRATVRYRRYPAAYLEAASFGRFRFGLDAPPEPGKSYLLSPWDDDSAFRAAGFTMRQYDTIRLYRMEELSP